MARKPNFDWSKQPQWVQVHVREQQEGISELLAQIEELEGQLTTLEGMFERAAIQEFDGLPVVPLGEALDNAVGVAYLETHDETTCPTADCPDRINDTHLV